MICNCTAIILYDVVVTAKSREDAEMIVFNRLADDVITGVIRTDLFDNDSGANLRFPWLVGVEVKEAL